VRYKKKYNTVEIVPKNTVENHRKKQKTSEKSRKPPKERGKKDTLQTQIHDLTLSWLVQALQ
jgi:hypothetical protein